jgi:hypothetical protein
MILEDKHININQGAESTLFFKSAIIMEKYTEKPSNPIKYPKRSPLLNFTSKKKKSAKKKQIFLYRFQCLISILISSCIEMTKRNCKLGFKSHSKALAKTCEGFILPIDRHLQGKLQFFLHQVK